MRWGKASRGSPPRRRTVLTVPEMDWVTGVLEHWVARSGPRSAPGIAWRRCGSPSAAAASRPGRSTTRSRRPARRPGCRPSWTCTACGIRISRTWSSSTTPSGSSLSRPVTGTPPRRRSTPGCQMTTATGWSAGRWRPGPSCGRDAVNRKMGYRWNLRALMADRGMFATSDLVPLLAERGVHLSREQVYRLVTAAAAAAVDGHPGRAVRHPRRHPERPDRGPGRQRPGRQGGRRDTARAVGQAHRGAPARAS